METSIDLTTCQVCKLEPAIYGDGVTWSRCSKCQLDHVRGKNKEESGEESPTPPSQVSEGLKHEINPNLVSIILPIYLKTTSLYHYTGNAIGSVREHTPAGMYELVVVDNGSPITPPSFDAYYAHKVIQNKENLGVTKAWNQGIRMSNGGYIVLLNNDVQVFDGWLEDMKKALDDGLDLVMACPMYSNKEPFARAVESHMIRTGNKKHEGNLKKDFSCVMFKRSLVEEIGVFDELFFNYCSDIDFLRRMDEKGKEYKILEHVATSHLSDATGGSIKETPEIMNKDKATYEEKYRGIPEPTKKLAPKKDDAMLFRTDKTGDAIYWLGKDNAYHHITSPEVLHGLGFEFGDEVTVSIEAMDQYKEGAPIDLKNLEEYKTYA